MTKAQRNCRDMARNTTIASIKTSLDVYSVVTGILDGEEYYVSFCGRPTAEEILESFTHLFMRQMGYED